MVALTQTSLHGRHQDGCLVWADNSLEEQILLLCAIAAQTQIRYLRSNTSKHNAWMIPLRLHPHRLHLFLTCPTREHLSVLHLVLLLQLYSQVLVNIVQVGLIRIVLTTEVSVVTRFLPLKQLLLVYCHYDILHNSRLKIFIIIGLVKAPIRRQIHQGQQPSPLLLLLLILLLLSTLVFIRILHLL